MTIYSGSHFNPVEQVIDMDEEEDLREVVSRYLMQDYEMTKDEAEQVLDMLDAIAEDIKTKSLLNNNKKPQVTLDASIYGFAPKFTLDARVQRSSAKGNMWTLLFKDAVLLGAYIADLKRNIYPDAKFHRVDWTKNMLHVEQETQKPST